LSFPKFEFLFFRFHLNKNGLIAVLTTFTF
jgi:hypothetical protein